VSRLHPAPVDAAGYVPFNDKPLSGHRMLLGMVPPGGRVLDVGCSAGYLSERMAAAGSEVIGLDLDPEAVKVAERFCSEVHVGDLERMDLPFEPGSFDAVVCGDIIEHLRDPDALLRRLRPLAKPGGLLALSTPNVANWTVRLKLAAGRFDYAERGIMDRTHMRFFTRRTLVECVEGAGWRIERLDFTAPVPVLGERFPALERGARAIASLRPTLFAFQWVVAARA